MVTDGEREKRRNFIELLSDVERGHADADGVYSLGTSYLYGTGVPKDTTVAYYWIRRAAEHGNASAQCHLGVMHAVGQGVLPDPAEALKWYRKAAEQGSKSAMLSLGQALDSGSGGPENAIEAVKWYRMAAQEHEAFSDLRERALYFLGNMYVQGRGVSQSFVNAFSLWKEAAIFGLREPKEGIEMLRKQMTKEQIVEAENLAHETLL